MLSPQQHYYCHIIKRDNITLRPSLPTDATHINNQQHCSTQPKRLKSFPLQTCTEQNHTASCPNQMIAFPENGGGWQKLQVPFLGQRRTAGAAAAAALRLSQLPRSLESIRVLFSGGDWFSFLEGLWIYFLTFDFKNGAFGPFLPWGNSM
jgi:hypothetical protein